MPGDAVAPEEAILKTLMKERSISVVRDDSSKKISVPKGMKISEAIKWLKRQQAAEETDVPSVREFPYHPADGAVQLARVLKKKYGWAALVPSGGFSRFLQN